MSPVDDVRYSYVISKDDDTSLPVELVVLSPAQIVASKFTVSAAHSASSENLSFPDETFDRVEKLSNKKKQNDLTIWPELTIPKPFTIESEGIQNRQMVPSLSTSHLQMAWLNLRFTRIL